jgi:hypothetical protein
VTESFETGVASVHNESNELLVYTYKKDAIVDEEDARLIIEYAKKLTPVPLPTLVLARNVRRLTHQARSLFADSNQNSRTAKVAIVVESPLSRVIANFFLGLNRPDFPTRLFNDEAEAREWLVG